MTQTQRQAVTDREAADILRAIADRNEAALGDIGQLDWDARRLLDSSGDLDLIDALRRGAAALETNS